MLLKGTKIDSLGNNDRTLLRNAVDKGNKSMIKFLLGKGANVNINDENGNTPLSIAKKKYTHNIKGYKKIYALLINALPENINKPHKAKSLNNMPYEIKVLYPMDLLSSIASKLEKMDVPNITQTSSSSSSSSNNNTKRTREENFHERPALKIIKLYTDKKRSSNLESNQSSSSSNSAASSHTENLNRSRPSSPINSAASSHTENLDRSSRNSLTPNT